MTVEISIVIPTYKRKDNLVRLLKSISEQVFDNIEIIIVNDDPETKYDVDFFKDIINTNITIINNNINLGVNMSRYIGARYSSGKYILFVDDDNVVSRDMISILYQDFEELDESVAALAPVAYYYSNKDRIWWCGGRFGKYTLRAYFLTQCGDKYIETDDVHNAFMIRRKYLGYMEITTRYFKRTFATFAFVTLLKKKGLKALVDTSAKIYHDAPYDINMRREVKLHELIGIRFDEDRIFHFFYEPIVYTKLFSDSYSIKLIRTIAQFLRLQFYTINILRSNINLSKRFSLLTNAYKGYIKGIVTKIPVKEMKY